MRLGIAKSENGFSICFCSRLSLSLQLTLELNRKIMKQIQKVIVTAAFFCLWSSGTSFSQEIEKTDSVQYVAERFLAHDIFINSYFVCDMDLESIEAEHSDWVLKYFPAIYERYDCTLYSQFSIAIALYKEGSTDQLSSLWKKWSYMFFLHDGRRSEGVQEREIWRLIDWSKLDFPFVEKEVGDEK